MMSNLVHGLTALGTGPHIAWLFVGALFGMIGGVIPGLGGPVVLSVVLAFIYHMDLTAVLCIFLGTHAGSYFASSIASILLNTPQHPESFASTFDGFPMSQRGEAGRALGISATATCIGGWIGCIALVGFIPIINYLPSLFHPPEYVALIAIALLLVGTLGTDQVSKAVVSAGLGLLVASIGPSVITGVYRYTFNSVGLYGGIALVALALGSFAVPQMILIFGTASVVARQDMFGNELETTEAAGIDRKQFKKQVLQGCVETLGHWVSLLRGAAIGVLTGLVPGIGAFAANFMSYGVAQQTSRKGRRELFGTGIVEGVIAPEASSLSKEAGHMVPVLGLGIPGGVGSALFIAALTIKGVRLGYGFAQSYPVIPYEVVWVIALAGLIGTAAALALAPWLARITVVPGPVLVPFILALAVVGPFIADQTYFDVVEVAAFAVVGFALRRLGYSLGSFVVGLVLGPTFESNIYLTHEVYHGWSFLDKRPLADVLFIVGLLILVLRAVQFHNDAKKARQPIEGDDIYAKAEAIRRAARRAPRYPLFAVIVTFGLLALALPMSIYALANWNFSTSAMPVIGGLAASAGLIWRLPFEIHNYLRYRGEKRALSAAQAPERELVPISGGSDAVVSLLTKEPAAVVEKAWGRHGQYTRELVGFLIFFALIGEVYAFGFAIGIPAFMVVYAMLGTRRTFRTLKSRSIFAVISAAAMWAMTVPVFNLLHLGFTPMWHL